MAITSLDELLRARTREVELPGGKIVVIEGLTAGYALSLRGRDLPDAEIFDMIAHSLIDPKMTAEQVGKMELIYIQPLLDAIMEFNSLKEGAAAAQLKKTERSALLTP